MATIKDIAELAEVSIGTVSNYLNNTDLLSEETHKRIKKAIRKLDYYPHAAARSLKSKQTKRIGIVKIISKEEEYKILPSDIVFLELFAAINAEAAEHGFSILMQSVTSEEKELAVYEQLIGEKQVDGMILTATAVEDGRIELLTERNFPFVAFGRTESVKDYSYIDVDGERGIAEAVVHLAELGHKKIAFVKSPEGLMCTKSRLEGFIHSMEEFNLPIEEELIVEGNFYEKSGFDVMTLLLNKPIKPTGVIFPNDLSALGAMKAAQSLGIQPGKQISVIGFDNIRLAEYWNPPLTTIAQPFRKIGHLLSKNLINMMKKNQKGEQIIISPELIIRGSTNVVQ